jgi:hypothetical protein
LQALVKREDVADVSTASGSRFTVTLASTVTALYPAFQAKANFFAQCPLTGAKSSQIKGFDRPFGPRWAAGRPETGLGAGQPL